MTASNARSKIRGPSLRLLPLEHCGKLRNFLPHDLAALELHRRALGDLEFAAWHVRITAHAGLRELYFKHAEIPKLDRVTARQRGRDVIQRLLKHIKNLMLYHPGFIGDR